MYHTKLSKLSDPKPYLTWRFAPNIYIFIRYPTPKKNFSYPIYDVGIVFKKEGDGISFIFQYPKTHVFECFFIIYFLFPKPQNAYVLFRFLCSFFPFQKHIKNMF